MDDVTVSRDHAILSVNNQRLKIIDSNSTNGIYVNNEIKSDYELRSGDKIQVGKYILLLTEVIK